MAFVVGGGKSSKCLFRPRSMCFTPASSVPSTKLGAGRLWCFSATPTTPTPTIPTTPSLNPSPLSILGALAVGEDGGPPTLWLWTSSPPLCSFPIQIHGFSAVISSVLGAWPLPGGVVSGGASDARWKVMGKAFGWGAWAGWVLGCLGLVGFCISTGVGSSFSTGVGSSFVVLYVIWAAGVGSGWSIVLLFVSTGLLCGFPLWYHVTVNRERLRWCLVLGLFATLKSVVFYGPSGIIIKLLTVLVSDPSTGGSSAYGGSNLRSTLRLDGLVLALYVTIVIVIVSLTLITYHMFIVD